MINLIRLILALGILLCLSIFIQVNVVELGGGRGYIFIALAGLLFISLLTISGDVYNILLIKQSTVFLLIFLFYFVANWYFDSYNIEDLKEVTFRTSGGVVFALILGFITAYALGAIYEVRKSPRLAGPTFLVCILYMLLVIGLAISGFLVHFGGIQSDLFLIQEKVGLYQRAGDLISMQFITVISLATTLLVTSTRVRLVRSIPVLIIVLILTVISAATAQIVGSNSGLAATLGFSLIFFVCFFAALLKHDASNRVGFANMLLGKLGLKLVVGTIISLSVVTAFVVFVVSYFNFDVNTLRFTGYGSGEYSSFESRFEIFRENFITHISYNPIFGHTKVEEMTTGVGTYVHSLLSIATHLGLVGATIFVGMIVSIYIEITRSARSRIDSIYTNAQYGLFRLTTLVGVIAMGLVASFFIWMPLWFAIGLFGNWFQQKRRLVSDDDYYAPSRSRRRRRRSLVRNRAAS